MNGIADAASAVSWLVSEIDEELDAGPTGLYQFIWTLRGRYPDAGMEAMRDVARRALDQVLTEPGTRMVWLNWGDFEPVADATRDDVEPSSWDNIGDAPYLGVVRP